MITVAVVAETVDVEQQITLQGNVRSQTETLRFKFCFFKAKSDKTVPKYLK